MPSLIPDAAAFERRLAGLPVAKHRAGETVLTAGSKTGTLLFLRSGAVGVVKDGEKIANVSAPGSVSANRPPSDQPHTADVRTWSNLSFMSPTRRRCLLAIDRRPLRSGDPRATTRCRQPVTDRS